MTTSNVLPQKAAACFLSSADVYSSSSFGMTLGDVSMSLVGSNLSLSNSNVVVFSSNVPQSLVSLPANIKLIKDPSHVTVRFGNSNVLRANANRFSPAFSNGVIMFSGASYSNPSYQPILANDAPTVFTRDISSPNIISLSNTASWSSNASSWSSNNLLAKTGAQVISGTTSLDTFPALTLRRTNGGGNPWVPGVSLDMGGYAGNSVSARISSTDAVGGQWGGQLHLYTKTKSFSDTNSLEMAMVVTENQRVGINKWDPQTALDVNGTCSALAFSGPTITSLTNSIIGVSNIATSNTTAIMDLQGSVMNQSIDLSMTDFKAMYSSNTATFAQDNVTTLSNLIIPRATFGSNTSSWSSNTSSWSSNVSSWSSNNLFRKTGGHVFGSNLVVSPASDTNLGIHLFGTGQDGVLSNTYNGGLASWNGIGFKCLTDGVTPLLHETRTGTTTISGNLICPTTQILSSNITWTSNATASNTTALASVGTNLGITDSIAKWSSNNTVWTSNSTTSNTTALTSVGTNLSITDSIAKWSSNNTVWSSNAIVSLSNTAAWSSNNLLPKTGGDVSGRLALSDNLVLRNGNENLAWGNKQIVFGFQGTSNYAHNIITRHDGGINNKNSIDFLLWDSNAGGPSNPPQTNSMSITSRGVGIFTSNPQFDLEVNGVVKVSSYISCGDVYSSGNVFAPQGSMSCKAGLIPYGGTYPIGTEFRYYGDYRNYIVGDTQVALGSNTTFCVGDTHVNMYDGSARMYVRGDSSFIGDIFTYKVFARSGLVLGTDTTETIKCFHPFSVQVGSSTTQTKTRTGLDIGITMPDSNYHAIVTYEDTGGANVFCGCVDNRTTGTLTLHTSRVNGTSWTVDLIAHILIWSY